MLEILIHNKKLGAIFTVFLASLFIFVLFNRHILEANQVSFASGGDGLKSTFGTLYHIQYDSSYWHFQGMNYPYGESVFFTGNQTFLTNIIKLCKDLGIDFSGKTLGILNLWMLFSFVLCALFLYLILLELDLPLWYSLVGSLLITFLSPQWDRLGGHYNLAYAWVIPVALYMMIRFYRKPSYAISSLFGLLIIIAAGKHVYFVALVGIIWIIYWIFLFIKAKDLYGRMSYLIPHFFIQMIIPFLAFSMFAGSYDISPDRTSYPWGFYSSTTRLEGVFLPLMKPYGRWIIVGNVKTLGYVGMTSTIVFVIIIALFVKKWVKEGLSRAVIISDKFILNVLFLGGLLALMISLGFPFTLGFRDLLNYTGPFRQLRAIGRFIFPFYYLMNIFTIWFLWKWYLESGKKWIVSIIIFALLVISIETYFNVYDKPERYYNKFEALNDSDNKLPQNQWVLNHDWSEYQAIMPLPYYHIGSENYWINGNSPVIEHSYIASLKTGLPLNSVMLSRTSINQTLAGLDLFYEPYHKYPVLDLYQPGKPVLLMHQGNKELSTQERELINNSILIDSGGNIKYYKMYPDSFNALLIENRLKWGSIVSKKAADSMVEWHNYESFSRYPGRTYSGKMTREQEFFSCTFPDSGSYTISFWYQGANRDLWPRTYLFINLYDSSNIRYSHRQTDFFRETVLRNVDWALEEFIVEIKNPGDRVVLSYLNKIVTGGDMVIDRVLARSTLGTIVDQDEGEFWINNRKTGIQK
ncbi:hypothetical protein ACFLTA_05995 [Bacteroidota bacterium]